MHGREVVRTLAQELPAAPPPAGGRVVLDVAFFRETASLLEYADHRLLDGDPIDLDELAQMLAAHLRPNLRVVYGPLGAR